MSELKGFEGAWFPSEWGKDDELGALNHITPEKVLSAMRLVRQGRTIPLGHPLFLGMPGRSSLHGPFFYWTSQRVYDHRPPLRKPASNKFGAALCRLELSDHLGTHMDALNHISYDGKLYNGVDAFETTAPSGTLKLGIDNTPPVVTRGILVDGTDGSGEPMKKGEPVSRAQTERFLREHSLTLQPGDAVLFHTGLSSLWFQSERYNEYYEESPGVGYDTACWLAEQMVSLVGADTPSTEVSPPEIPGSRLPVHQHLITRHGVRLLDNLKLDELAKEKVYEFLLIASPLRVKGGTASPIVPVALF
jgi:kynurenine formamidase